MKTRNSPVWVMVQCGVVAWVWVWVAGLATGAPYGREVGLAAPGDAPRLVTILERSEASLPEKARACQQLSLIGGKEAVPALAKLLAHPDLATYARTALEAIPDPAATAALRGALSELTGKYLVGVVNTLGVRGDADAVAALSAVARDPSRGAAPEALAALGRIGTDPAMEVVRAALGKDPAALRSAAAQGCLVAAERWQLAGRADAAVALYEAVRQAEVPAPLRQAGLRGLVLTRPAEGWPLVLEALKSSDAGWRKVAATLAREAPGAEVSRGLEAALAGAEPGLQVLLLAALAQRGERGAAAAIEKLAGADASVVRLGALSALGSVGAPSSVPILVDAVTLERSTEEASVAAGSLAKLAVSTVDSAVIQAVAKAAPGARVRLIQVLGQRRSEGAVTELLRQSAEDDPAVSRAAFEALPAVATPRDLPELIRVTDRVKDEGVRNQAERALYAVAIKEPVAARRSEPLATAMSRGLSVPGRISMMQVMSMLGDATAAQVVGATYEDPDPALRDAALRLLVHWPDARPAPRLLGIFKQTSQGAHRSLALQGLVTLATLWKDDPTRPANAAVVPPAEAVQWLKEANAAIRDDPAEKKAILGGLGDLNCRAGLELLAPYLQDAAVRTEAGQALLRAAKGLTSADDKGFARPLVEKVRDAAGDSDLRREAEAVLKGL